VYYIDVRSLFVCFMAGLLCWYVLARACARGRLKFCDCVSLRRRGLLERVFELVEDTQGHIIVSSSVVIFPGFVPTSGRCCTVSACT
jgi:hypothetical protein